MFIDEDDLLGISNDLKQEIMENMEALDRACNVVSRLDDLAREAGYTNGYIGVVTEISTSTSHLEELLKKAMAETPFQSTKEDIRGALETIKPLNCLITDNKASLVDNLPQELFDDDGLREYVIS